MMKTKLLLFILFLLVQFSFRSESRAQDCYIVMKIKGIIVLESSGNQLTAGEQICTEDNVIFKSSDAVAIVHSSAKGRYTIKPNKSRSSEIEGVIKESVASALSKSKANLETRAEIDLKKEFGDIYCVIENSLIGIDEEEFPMDAKKYFVIRYTYHGKEYNKILKFNKGSIILDKKTVYTLDENSVDQNAVDEVSLYYRDETLNIQKSIARFRLRIMESGDLIPEADELINSLKSTGKTTDEIKTELYLYLFDVYGKIDTGNFENWVKENFSL